METKRVKRVIYPLDVTKLQELIRGAQAKTGIRSRAALLRMAVERGLPVLVRQLSSHKETA